MTPLTSQNRYPFCATITRNPTAGQTGLTTVAQDVPCSRVYPANMRKWNANFATDFVGHEAYLNTEKNVKPEDVLELDSQSYTVKMVNSWPPMFKGMASHVELLLEERRK